MLKVYIKMKQIFSRSFCLHQTSVQQRPVSSRLYPLPHPNDSIHGHCPVFARPGVKRSNRTVFGGLNSGRQFSLYFLHCYWWHEGHYMD